MTANAITADQAHDQLVADGYHPDDVAAAIDSLILAGLEIDSDDGTTWITPTEMDVLVRQLDE